MAQAPDIVGQGERVADDDEFLLPLDEQGICEARGRDGEHERPYIYARGLLRGPGEMEAQPPVRGIARVEGQGTHHEPRQENDGDHPKRVTRIRIELASERVDDESEKRDDAPPENRLGAAEIVEGLAVEAGAAVEVFFLADLRPGRVDAERHQAEKQIHDPDAEVLAGASGELGAHGARRWRAGRRPGSRRPFVFGRGGLRLVHDRLPAGCGNPPQAGSAIIAPNANIPRAYFRAAARGANPSPPPPVIFAAEETP